MAAVFITGGAGFIGSHLTDFCLEKGHKVTVFDNLSTGTFENLAIHHPNLTFIKGDICDKEFLASCMKNQEIVIHLAASVSVVESIKNPPKSKKVNIDGSFNVIELCRIYEVQRVFFASSAAVYGQPETSFISETHSTQPISPYGLEKLTIEQYLYLYNRYFRLNYVAGRFFNIYGTRQNPSSPYSGVISVFSHALSYGHPITIYGDGEQSRDFLYVGDLVRMIYDMVFSEIVGVFNCGSGHSYTINHLVEILSKLTDQKNIDVTYMPIRQGDIQHSLSNMNLYQKYFLTKPAVSLENGLKELLEFFK